MAVALWFVAAGMLLVIELQSGTIYLLAIALALALAGSVAWLGGTPVAQLALAAIGGSIGCVIAHRVRRRQAKRVRLPVTDEVGQWVTVVTAGPRPRVSWRGTEWDAVLADSSAALPAERLRIARQEGNILVLDRL